MSEDTPATGGEVVPLHGASVARRLRDEFDEGQIALIKNTVAKDCDTPELAMFLETCVRHDLDPFIKEIWAIKIKSKVQIFASRDGLMGIANRHTPAGKYQVKGEGMFLGCPSGVVREHDQFDFWREEREDGTEKACVDHRPRDKDGKPTHGGADGELRGKIVAAWAKVKRRGHDDTFFVAYAKQYDQSKNAWTTHPDAMIQKCAESVALRKAFSIAGVVGEGELPRSTLSAAGEGGSADIDWPEDSRQKDEINDLAKELGWRRAKLRMVVNAVGEEGGDLNFNALLDRMNHELEQRKEAEVKTTRAEEEQIQDADVVEDGEGEAA